MTKYKERLQWVNNKPYLFYRGQWRQMDISEWYRPKYKAYISKYVYNGRCIYEGWANCDDWLHLKQIIKHKPNEFLHIVSLHAHGNTRHG